MRLTTTKAIAVTMALCCAFAMPRAWAQSNVFINEFHYDNLGSDVGEFVEVAGPAGTDLSAWSLVFYNGSNGTVYRTISLSGTIPAEAGCGGFGTVAESLPSNGAQNGAPDGIALVNGTSVVQFLSYEGTFTAVDGPAAGLTSTNVGVAESSGTAIGQSLQLQGSGAAAGDFTWAGPLAQSPGDCNAGQSFGGAVDAPPEVSSTTPDDGAIGVDVGTDISIDFNEDVTVTDPWFTISCTVSGTVPASVSGGGAAFTLVPAVELAGGELCTVSLAAAKVVDQDGDPDPLADDFSFSFTTLGECGDPATLISQVQGSGQTSPLEDNLVTVEGIVVGDYQSSDDLNGFFIQEEDSDADADALTSEGLFVFEGGSTVVVAEGDRVRVSGEVDEFSGLTELTNLSSVINCGPGGTVSPASIDLPAPAGTDEQDTFEAVEGMLVQFADELTVTEYFQLGRFGQVLLSEGGRQIQFTDENAPSVAGYAAHLENIARARIILDDTSNDQNPDFVFHPQPAGFSVDNFFRGGDTVSNLTGVMHWSFAGSGATNAWRIRPRSSSPVVFDVQNTRTIEPDDVGGTLRVAAFNVLNYFTTIDSGAAECGPDDGQGCRGADSVGELARQTDKIVAALTAIDADLIGLMELENNATASLQALVDALNAEAGAGSYAFVNTGTIGGDAIKVGLIYSPQSVSPVGGFEILDSTVDENFLDDKNRPTLIQTFEESGTGERFTIAVNHLKSKGSACDDVGDPDTGDGQANCNQTRTRAAQALVDYLASDPTNSEDDDFLIMGDLNAYAKEDPISAIKAGGYADLVDQFMGPDAYSFVFDGQLGYLDHALASESLAAQVTAVTTWHINADEVNLLDYNDDVVDPAEASFEAKPLDIELYSADAYRTSDHDPTVVGLRLGGSTRGDLDGDGNVDRGDLNVILGRRNTPAGGPSDPADLDGDGVITVLDARILVTLCALPRCAVP